MNTITFEGEEFHVTTEGDDIVLQGEKRDIEIHNAHRDLEDECIREIRYPVWNGDYMEHDWNPDHVADMVRDRLNDYALDHASEGVTLMHD